MGSTWQYHCIAPLEARGESPCRTVHLHWNTAWITLYWNQWWLLNWKQPLKQINLPFTFVLKIKGASLADKNQISVSVADFIEQMQMCREVTCCIARYRASTLRWVEDEDLQGHRNLQDSTPSVHPTRTTTTQAERKLNRGNRLWHPKSETLPGM